MSDPRAVAGRVTDGGRRAVANIFSRRRVKHVLSQRTVKHVLSRRTDYPNVVAIIVAGLWIYVRELGRDPLRRWDEAIYGTVAREMLASGEWLLPRVSGGMGAMEPHLFVEKPPLVYWLQAASMSLLGTTELAIRLQSATFAVLTGVLVYVVGRELVDRRVGLFGAAIFLLTPFVYAGNNAGRLGGTDMAMVFFGTLAVYLTWRAVERDASRLLVPAGIALALAALTKGFNAGIFGVIALPLILVHRRWFRAHIRSVGNGIAAFALVALPWPLYVYSRIDREFVDVIFVEQVVDRVAGRRYVDPEEALFEFMNYPYFLRFPGHFDPWSYFLVPAVVYGFWRSRRDGDRERTRRLAFLCWWAGSVLAFFALTGNHGWYLLPMYVPASILVGWFVADLSRERTSAGTLALAASVLATLVFSFRLGGESDLPIDGFLTGTGFVVLLIATAVLVLVWPELQRRFDGRIPPKREVLRATVSGALVLCFVFALAGSPPALAWGNDVDQMEFAHAVNAEVPADTTVFVDERLGDRPMFTFGFYVDRPLSEGDLSELAGDETYDYAIIIDRGERRFGDRTYREVRSLDLYYYGGHVRIAFLELE